MNDLIEGAQLLLAPGPIIAVFAGLTLGFVIGVLPGLNASNAAALILPFSLALGSDIALFMMLGVYAGASYAGAVPAILINVPGTASSAATAVDGYQLTLQGKGEFAIGVARMASALGGILAVLILLPFFGAISEYALSFGSRETFWLVLLAFVVVSTLLGTNMKKGVIAGLLGVLIAAMSANAMYPGARMTFGFPELYEEVPFVPVILGLFGFGTMFAMAMKSGEDDSRPRSTMVRESFRYQLTEAWSGAKFVLRRPLAQIRGSVVGLAVGVVPGLGTAASNWMSYGLERRVSKHPERFGSGAPEGVQASESADNATIAGTLVPTMALGIPGSATAAIMLAALHLHGIQPGPNLMQTEGPMVYSLLWSVLLASFIIVPLGLILAAPLTRVARMPKTMLAPMVIVLCAIGAFAFRNNWFDVALALVFGFVGILMRMTGYPLVPLLLGLILGPMLEASFLRSMRLANDEVSYFFGSMTSIVLVVVIILFVVFRIERVQKSLTSAVGSLRRKEGV